MAVTVDGYRKGEEVAMFVSMFEVDQLVARAYALAELAHEGQVDKAGAPYLDHVVRVARRVAGAIGDPVLVAVALVHDVVEDSEFDLGVVMSRLAPELNADDARRAQALVDALTHRKNESRSTYIDRILAEPRAVIVKIADMLDNVSRLDSLAGTAMVERLAHKYTRDLTQIAGSPAVTGDFVAAGLLAMVMLRLHPLTDEPQEWRLEWTGVDIDAGPISRTRLSPLPDRGWGGTVELSESDRA